MTKKIFAVVVAAMMVMALSVTVFADVDLSSEFSGKTYDGDNARVVLPEGLDVSDGTTVTVKIKGTSDSAKVRLYLTDAGDVGIVTNIAEVVPEGGAFEATVELVIDLSGTYAGTAEPTVLMIKGENGWTPLVNTTIESVVIVGADVAAPADEADAAAPTNEADAAAPADEAGTTAPADEDGTTVPSDTTAAPDTGLALAVIPAVMALAAVAVAKKH